MNVRNYVLVTAGYWAFTLTDGALRMLVLLYFHDLGYSPVSIAFLFLLYEFMGIITNLIGGWVGARSGLNRTLLVGLALQIVALLLLSSHQPSWPELASVGFVMGAQALSGVAKDLTKMSSKSAVKFVAGDGDGALFRLVAVLTGSKNALKGVGFFLGAALLSAVGYDAALWLLAALVALALIAVAIFLNEDIGRSSKKPPLRSILSKSPAINRLAAARFFLFGSRDIWFVVALPIFLDERLGWSFEGIGGFLAAWVIGYGMIQSVAPQVLGRGQKSGGDATNLGDASNLDNATNRGDAEVAAARLWALVLAGVSAVIAIAVAIDFATTLAIVGGLVLFGVVFALNSSLHSYLILAYSNAQDVSLDVGFYYSANAGGRLIGTLLSGVLYLLGGLDAALWGSTAFVIVAWVLTLRLPPFEHTEITTAQSQVG